ncbi:DICT sensory domain-containing protein [Spirulina sp. CS-785/01]|uniref:DICT sensory domain-containing protein n=1 Tax=Spirulina sp. CS-785/01 TaxID=3021716 RepID=UPI00232E59E1|nr:DICT sensory domain-containing protein [Spirulina sp. CS-785/01]MDB9313649.1 DICT sensory domain-containing protein [Spirulina sp. CS-785/01]
MSIPTSVLAELLHAIPNWRPQMYFKSSLVALSHAMEDQVLAGNGSPLVIATFQRERFYRQEAHRYRRIARQTDQVYVLSAPETDFKNQSGEYETIAFDGEDGLTHEWHLVVITQQYANCLICRERASQRESQKNGMDSNRRFEGIWTSDQGVCEEAAKILLERIVQYRPELTEKVNTAKSLYLQEVPEELPTGPQQFPTNNPDPFVNRLVNYLQVGQYKLMKAYRAIASQEQKERLIHLMTVAIRRSLDPQKILEVAVEQLGQVLGACRSIIYRCGEADETATITHEYLRPKIPTVQGETWLLQQNPFFQTVLETRESLLVKEVANHPSLEESPQSMQNLVKQANITSWLFVPVLYQGRLIGMVELHHCGTVPDEWAKEEIALVEAVANQVGVALIQAESYASLEVLNQQLEELDNTRSNLVAITGHELRTPLSTIQICLESLASEPDMSPELRQVMLNTALADAERMRTLVQDFLTLSQLESGRVEWNPEPLSMYECVELGVSHIRSHTVQSERPNLEVSVPENLPLVQADGEWLVEVLTKLLDNANKFTSVEGEIAIAVQPIANQMLQVTITDTGRGIEPNRLETVFDRFYQEEGALQRTTGGTGLGLAICRQIVQRWHGKIWAESEGKDKGSQFHFTIPIARSASQSKSKSNSKSVSKSKSTGSSHKTKSQSRKGTNSKQ